MEIGIDSFAASKESEADKKSKESDQVIGELLDRIELADICGVSTFGIGEHYRQEFLDSAPSLILAAAAARTRQIRLTSAVTVLSAADPVRIFQQFATLDLISRGRAEIIVGRGSFAEAFPLFGINLSDYDDIFIEKLKLLLMIRDQPIVNWKGSYRPALEDQSVYPRPKQKKLPIWLGVGGTPSSFVRAGEMGLPLMIAIIGGNINRFAELVGMYKEAGKKAGHKREALKVGVHVLGYVGSQSDVAKKEFFPGYERSFNKIGKERGWPRVTEDGYNRMVSPEGPFLVGCASEVIEKIQLIDTVLGGISRINFQMSVSGLSHAQLCQSIELIGRSIIPKIKTKKV